MRLLIGKSHDTFAPLGPFVAPGKFVPDPHTLAIRFTLNGDAIQNSSTAREKPIYMKPGDLSVCSIERIGVLTNPMVAGAS